MADWYYRCRNCGWDSFDTIEPEFKPSECGDCGGDNFELLQNEPEWIYPELDDIGCK